MIDWLLEVASAHQDGRVLTLQEQPLPGDGRVLALAPHPDDPDAIAVTLRLLALGGWEVHWAIVTSGSSGVQDAIAGSDRVVKAQLREREQRYSAQLFGLPAERLHFWRLVEDTAGELAETEDNRARFTTALAQLAPALVLLPCGEDSNPTHRTVFTWFNAWAQECPHPLFALGNEDPKSLAFTPDLQVLFTEETARWKAALLECHRSQSARNQATRGISFAQRILAVNRVNLASGYAERFQVAFPVHSAKVSDAGR